MASSAESESPRADRARRECSIRLHPKSREAAAMERGRQPAAPQITQIAQPISPIRVVSERPAVSVYRATGGYTGIELDFAECAFVIGNILLQNCRQRFGLLRAQINSLKIFYLNLVFRLLLHGAKDEKKVPYIHAHLHAVGVSFAIFGGIDHIKIGLRRNDHKPHSLTGSRTEGNWGKEDWN